MSKKHDLTNVKGGIQCHSLSNYKACICSTIHPTIHLFHIFFSRKNSSQFDKETLTKHCIKAEEWSLIKGSLETLILIVLEYFIGSLQS